MKRIDQCGVCSSSLFESLWRLPKLPLTERFGKYNPDAKLSFDQELLMCMRCGHAQLGYQLDPFLLYTQKNYSFRTGESKSAISGTAFFINFLEKVSLGKRFDSLLDIGGNDLYLAKQLHNRVTDRCVVDPICHQIDGQVVDGVKVFGRMIEDVDLSRDMAQPDLVVCRHTLEHVSNPANVLRQLFEECRSDSLYVFEIPCFENLSEGLRFDAIFHQHYHYYDIVSFRQLLQQTGGEYLTHAFNYHGSCGGSIAIAFKKAAGLIERIETPIKRRVADTKIRIKQYCSQMDVASALLKSLPKPVYGYGASLMLATLGYHLQTDFTELDCVLDDDKQKDNMTYENISVVVHHPDLIKPPKNSCYLITSLENMRPIYRRIQEFEPRRILMPIVS